MQAPINTEALQEKWAPLLNAEGQDKITDPHRKMVTAVLLENQEKALREERELKSLFLLLMLFLGFPRELQ